MSKTENQELGKTKANTENEVETERENDHKHHHNANDKEESPRSTERKGQVVINMEKGKDQTKSQLYNEGKNMPKFWVQFNYYQGNQEPEENARMKYDPSRNYFVKMVFSIVLFMLILTCGFVMFVYMTDLRAIYLQYGAIPAITGMLGMIGLNYAMMCSHCTRVPPCNFICLFLAVCFMSLIAAYITARYRTQVVLFALMATTITVMVCLGLACTNFDFTKYLLYVIVISAAFGAIAMIVSITMMVTRTRYKPVTLVILVVGTILNVVILIMELQMILGGKTVELSEDDYALAAYMLYTSIVDIFLKLVQLMGILDAD